MNSLIGKSEFSQQFSLFHILLLLLLLLLLPYFFFFYLFTYLFILVTFQYIDWYLATV